MVAIGAYFVAKGLFGAAGFCGVIVTAAIAVAIVHNIDTFTSLGLKTGTVDASVEAGFKGSSQHVLAGVRVAVR